MKHLYPSLTTALMASCVFAPVAIAGGQGGPNLSAVPSHAQPGECYARVKHDAVYAPHSEIVIVEEGYERLEIDPAVLQSRTEQVLTKEASVRYEVRQPQYSTVTEQMMVRPSYEKLSVSPPQFSTVTETVQISAPRVVWKRGNPGALAAQGYNVLSTATGGSSYGGQSSHGGYSGYNGAPSSHGGGYSGSTGPQHCGPDCEIWCLVEEPGEAVTYQRKVVSDPGRVQRQTVPAKFQTITKQVVSDPGGVREIPIPAEYSSVTVEDIVQMGGERYVSVPPVHGAIETQVFAEPERYEWMRVICSTGQVMGPASQYTPAMPHSSHSAPTYGGSYSSGASSYTGIEIYSDGGHSGGSSYGQGSYGSGHSGIIYGGESAPHATQSYNDKQPSALIYGSSNAEAPSYGIDYHSSSQPRTYGGEGMNAHHSANTTR